MIYEGDINVVTMNASNSCENILIVTVGGKDAMYVSDLEKISVEFGSLMRMNGQLGVVKAAIYVSRANPAYSNVINVDFYVCRGRTLATRRHGSGRKLIVPYGVQSVDIPVIAPCKISSGNWVQTYSEPCIADVPVGVDEQGLILVQYDVAQDVGDVHNLERVRLVYFDYERVSCENDNIYIQWYDVDGCRRYAAGILMRRNTSAESVEFIVGDTVINASPDRVVGRVSEEWEVGIPNVSKDLQLGEIIFSEDLRIWTQGGGIPVTISGNNLSVDELKGSNIVLKLKTLF